MRRRPARRPTTPAARRPAPPATPAAPPTTRSEAGPARVEPGDGPPSAGRLHDVLLGLAGRLDDDALTSVREMVAAEDDAEAAELLGGCLLAGGVGLTGDERAVLRPWFAAARVDAELLGLLPADSGALERSVHRFVATAADRAPGVPLARAARRLTGVVAVRESWRVTPAGSAPGPVPHRVVLVETVGPDDCDHVVHHLAHAARALDDTSVEVFATGAGLPAYHRDALAAARPLVADEALARAAASPVAQPTPAPRARAVPRFGVADEEETWRTVADSGTSRTGPVPPVAAPQVADEPEDDPEEPGLEDLDDDDAADHPPAADHPRVDGRAPAAPTGEEASVERRTPSPAPPAEQAAASSPLVAPPAAPKPAPAAPAASETSIDEDLSSTARRIAALWAKPSPEDFSAPLTADSLEPTRLEPADDLPARNGHPLPSGESQPATEPEPELEEDEDEDEAPTGRHGRPAASDLGTTSFRAAGSRPRTNGHRVTRRDEPVRDDEPTPDTVAGPPSGSLDDDAPDAESAQVQRARHSRAREGDLPPEPDAGPARFGHDARFGAGPGPAWPGGPVPGDGRPGPDTLFVSPVEVGREPVSFGSNGHRHGPDPGPADDEPDTLGTNGHRHDAVVAAPDDEPATGPVAWSGPAGPTAVGSPPPAGPAVIGPPPGPPPAGPPSAPAGPGPGAPPQGPPRPAPPGGPPPGAPPVGPPVGGPGPRRPGEPGDEVAPPWATADGAGWTPQGPGRVPGPPPAPPAEPDGTAAWSPDFDDSVAQLSDRERELLARLHEELAQRERSEGADPFGPSRPAPPGPRPPRPGSPGGRVNGHGLPPGGPDDASA